MRSPLSAARLALALLASLVVLVAAGSARATTIGQFTFDDGTLASSDADPNSTASLALNGPSGVGGEDGNPPPGLIVSLPFSSAGELYQSVVITLTPAAGYELNLSSLTFDGSTSYFSPTIPSATFLAAVRSNLDGFASDIGTASWAAGHQTPGFVSILIDLSAAAFQGLSAADLAPVGGSLQLKFFLAMTSCPPVGGVNSYLDNLLVSGTTTLAPPPVPEPAAALLVVLGLAGAALRRSLS